MVIIQKEVTMKYSNDALIGSLQRAATSIFPPLHLVLDDDAKKLMLPQIQFASGSPFPKQTKQFRENAEKEVKDNLFGWVKENALIIGAVGIAAILLLRGK